MSKVEINCTNCGAQSLLQREPIYEGLFKTGEKLTCTACGFHYPTLDAVPFQHTAPEKSIFTDADRSAKPELFKENEAAALCRHCANYIVNPFTQFCSIHKKEVQATDSCPQFSPIGNDNSENPTL